MTNEVQTTETLGDGKSVRPDFRRKPDWLRRDIIPYRNI